ncbi:MAG: hypothetical protein IKN57_05075, partial [Parasporobacterium sp.]|nr:hypothetical protein [Parasporobacterium sp.]
ERQCDYNVVPEDVFKLPQTRIADGNLEINDISSPCLIQPYFERIPDHLAEEIADAAAQGLTVYAAEALPEATVRGQALPARYTDAVRVLPLERIGEEVERARSFFTLSEAYPHLRSFVTVSEDSYTCMFFNESVSDPVDCTLAFLDKPWAITEYDAWNNRKECFKIQDGRLRLMLEPGEARVFLFPAKDADEAQKNCDHPGQRIREKSAEILTSWTVSKKAPPDTDFSDTGLTVSGRELPNMNSPKYFAEFSGSYRYRGIYSAEEGLPAAGGQARILLYLPEIGDCAEVYVNGLRAGTAPYSRSRTDITELLHQGENEFDIIVTNTLVWQLKDPVSTQVQIAPTGMTKPPVIEVWK